MDFRPVVLGPWSSARGPSWSAAVHDEPPHPRSTSPSGWPVRLARPVGPTPREGTGLGTRG